MKNLLVTVLSVSLLILLYNCTSETKPEAKEESMENMLEGSWRLIKTVEIGHEDSTGRQDSRTKMYQKHVTPTHFTWIEYDIENDQLNGTGGGTYTLQGNNYTEVIKFFYPPGSAEFGQAIPFQAELKDGKWYHTGYVNLMEFDPESGEHIVVDSSIIDEIWERNPEKPNKDLRLVGSWALVKIKNEGDSVYTEYPDFVGYIKHITPTHFTWVQYNKDGDEVISEGGGTYTLEGDVYTETIEFIHPSGSNQVGTVLPFDCKLQDGRWHHKGNLKRIKIDDGTGETVSIDSTVIDEVWAPFEGPGAI